KEEADDYRYFPEPDLVPVEPPAEMVASIRAELRESPATRIVRITPLLDLDRATVLVTTSRDRVWSETVEAGGDALASANPIINPPAESAIGDARGREIKKLVDVRERIPRAALDEALSTAGPGFSAEPYLAEEAVSDASELEPLIDAVLAANSGQVEAYRNGKDGLLGFFVGQVMKETQGKANPRVVSELVRAKLSG